MITKVLLCIVIPILGAIFFGVSGAVVGVALSVIIAVSAT